MFRLPRTTPKPIYKYYYRLYRCINRALKEGGLDLRFADAMIFGTSIYSPEQQKIDHDRIAELMCGLKL